MGDNRCKPRSVNDINIVLNVNRKAGVLLFPRLGAFSENVWTKEERKSFPRFCGKLEDYNRALRFIPLDFAKKSTAFPGAVKRFGAQLKKRLSK